MESEIDVGQDSVPDIDELTQHDFSNDSVPAHLRQAERQLLIAIEKHDQEDKKRFLREKVSEIDRLRTAIERELGGEADV